MLNICFWSYYSINACLISDIYPRELKTSTIIPLFKKGDTKDASNNRPKSILPSLSKKFEKMYATSACKLFCGKQSCR